MPQRDPIIYPGEPLTEWQVLTSYGVVCSLGDHLMSSGTRFRRTGSYLIPECAACVAARPQQEAA